LALDRLLDQACTGPRYLSQPAIARLVVEALHYGPASLRHYPLHAFVGMANHLHLLITPQVALPKLRRSLKGITAKRANQILVMVAPHTPQTEHMMGARQFAFMIIAVSRGMLYDTSALVAALQNQRLARAGLDVTDPEPLPKGHPLWKFENVIITPHIAGRSEKEYERYMALFKENLRRFGAGERLLHVVDKEKGY